MFFRHSFASNLAAASVDQRIIDEWMGHQTEEQMRTRYRHLFPTNNARPSIQYLVGMGSKPWFLMRSNSSCEISHSSASPRPVGRFRASTRCSRHHSRTV